MLWWRLGQDQQVWRKRLGSMVFSVAYAPDGKLIAAAGQDKVIYLIDPVTRETRATIRGEWDQVLSVAFGPDGQRLAIGTWSGDIFVRHISKGTNLPLRGHKGAVYGLAFSPDGRLIASGGMDKTTRLWDLASPGTGKVLPGPEKNVYQVAFRPDGKELATAGEDGKVRLWDLTREGAAPRTLEGHGGLVFGVHYSPDSKRLASASFDRTIGIWRLPEGKRERTLRGAPKSLLSVRFSPDGKHLASSGYDGLVRTWHADTGALVASQRGHDEMVEGLAFSPDGRYLVSGSRDRSVRLWASAATSRSVGSDQGHSGPVYGLNFSPDASLIASSGVDGTIRIWRRDSGHEERVLRGHKGRVRGLVFNPDGDMLASVGYDRTVRLWDLSRGGDSRVLGGARSQMESVRFSPDGRLLATGSGDTQVRLWDVKARTMVRMLKGHSDRIKDLSFSPDGERLVSAARDGTLRVWRVSDGKGLGVLEGHKGEVSGVTFLPPAGTSLVSCGSDGTVRLWDLGTGANRVLEQHQARAYKVALLKGRSQVVVSWSDKQLSVVPLGVGQVRRVVGHHSEVNTVAASADGAFVASAGDDGTVRLWGAQTWTPVWRTVALTSHPPRILSHVGWGKPGRGRGRAAAPATRWAAELSAGGRLASQSDDGKRICIAGTNGSLALWNLEKDRRLFNVTLGKVKQLETTSAGCLVLSGGEAQLVDGAGQVKILARGAGAVSWESGQVLVAGDTQVHLYDLAGKKLRSWTTGPGVTALTRVDGRLALGFRDGNIQLMSGATRGDRRKTLTFEDVPASEVVRMLPGPKGTLVAGFANGQLGIWSLDNGARLRHSRLHGAVRHIALAGGKLLAATELGDHMALDLSTFRLAYCELLRQVWKEVPVLWENGLPVKRAAGKGHACFKP